MVIDDIDDKYDYPEVSMAENMLVIVDETHKNCDYGTSSFTQMMVVTETDRDDNNCYSRLIFDSTADNDNYHWNNEWESKWESKSKNLD